MDNKLLKDFTKGWIIGDFEPSIYQTSDFEIAIKNYKAGESEKTHYHKIATEWTIITKGRVIMNEVEYKEGDIIKINPYEKTNFNVIEETTTVVIKIPSCRGDKYE
jgi:hypothetical protein